VSHPQFEKRYVGSIVKKRITGNLRIGGWTCTGQQRQPPLASEHLSKTLATFRVVFPTDRRIVRGRMAAGRSSLLSSWLGFLVLFGTLLSFATESIAATGQDTQYVEYTDNDGQTVWLADNRRPALYTQNFGDCMGDSLINVTRFDAAYYKDNMTVLFHLAGDSSLTNQSLMCTFSPLSIAMGSS
jgi:hypothetical protein